MKFHRAMRFVLCVALLTAAGLKLAGGHHDEYYLSKSTFYIIVGVELLSAAGLYSRFVELSILVSIALFLGGVVLGIVHPGSKCGCLGPLSEYFGYRLQLFISGSLGLLSTLTLIAWIRGSAGLGSNGRRQPS
jgi:glucose dehydrogenase